MLFRLGLTCLLVFVLEQASGLPISDARLATRDHTQKRPIQQDGLALERDLEDRARHSRRHESSDATGTGDIHKPQIHIKALPKSKPSQTRSELTSFKVAPSVKSEPARDGFAAETKRQRASEASQKNKDNTEHTKIHEKQDFGAEASGGSSKGDAGYSNSGEVASEGEESALSTEEEEILRTVVMTLRDNPELIKMLLESEDEEMDEEFSKQKAEVSDPEDPELWGSFSDDQRPKQVEKKAGHRAALPRRSGSGSDESVNKDGVIQLPVNTAERQPPSEDEIKADVIDFTDSGETADLPGPKSETPKQLKPHFREPNPLNLLREGNFAISKIKPNFQQGNNRDAPTEDEKESSESSEEKDTSDEDDTVANDKTSSEAEGLLEDGVVDAEVPQSSEEESTGLLEDGVVDSDRPESKEAESTAFLEDGIIDSGKSVSSEEGSEGSLEDGVVNSESESRERPTSGLLEDGNVDSNSEELSDPQTSIAADDNEEMELQALSELNKEFARLEEEQGVKLHM